MEEDKGDHIGEHEKKDSEHESGIRSLVEDKTQISIDNNPDRTFKPAEFKKTVKKNPWIIATIVLGIIALILLVLMLRGGITGNIITGKVVGEGDISERLMEFGKAQGINLEILDITLDGDFYEVLISINGQESKVKLTKDGENMVQLIPLISPGSGQTPPVDVVKSDKPKVELVITSHCPYGLQGTKGILPVFKLLGDKIDSSVRYFNIPSHGEKEEIEAKRAVCIREQQKEKFFDYLACYVKEGESENCLKETNIDETKLNNCLENDIQNYYSGTSEIDLDVGSSPTLVINGQQVQAGRSPAAYLETICSSFNNAPEECNEELSTANPSAGFGYTASAGGNTNAQC